MAEIKLTLDEATIFIIQAAYVLGCQHGGKGQDIRDRNKIAPAVIAWVRQTGEAAQ